ncbi:MAG: CinA family nicotinamide mononucleotide deamidase-related protein [bacterium]|nr:MAG: CinA family nicotinamide mononucleotide deamidase-related protein [bacterium]
MKKRLEIITVGDEVLRGEVQEDNARYLSRCCSAVGLEPSRVSVLPDGVDSLAREIVCAVKRSRIVIVTGGLGPTTDDITKEAAVRGLELETEFRDEIVVEIAERFRGFGRSMPDSYRDQGRIPAGAVTLPNTVGLAVGLLIAGPGYDLFLLPGVPAEMRAMFDSYVLPRLREGQGEKRIRFRTFALTETEVQERLAGIPVAADAGKPAIISSPSGVDLYLYASALTGDIHEEIRLAFGSYLYAAGDRRMEEMVLEMLASRREKLAVAESVTGGLLASTIVSVPGASDVFVEGWITYGDDAKIERLGTAAASLGRFGAVSSEVCAEMAVGARERSMADFALATTGIAGPGGGIGAKPVGLCYVGCACSEGQYVQRLMLPGDRSMIRSRTVFHTLDLLRLILMGERERIEQFSVGPRPGAGGP